MKQLFPALRADLARLRELIHAGPAGTECAERDARYPDVFQAVERLLADHESALAFFLAYPTHRLWLSEHRAAQEAVTMIAWLAQHPPLMERPEKAVAYRATLDRLRSGTADWRLAVKLAEVVHDLDAGEPESLN